MRLVSVLAFLVFATPAHAEEAKLVLPAAVKSQVKTPLSEVGSGRYRKLGFSVYEAKLWAPGGEFDREKKPYALQLHYLRDLSKETVVGAVVDDVRRQQMADAYTMNEWQQQLTEVLSEVKEGDEIVGVSIPGKPSKLYKNGEQIASITDKRLSDSFFNIWLGDIANPDLRAKLLAQSEQ